MTAHPCKYSCGAMLTAHEKVQHERHHCTALAERRRERKCKWRECALPFRLKTQSPRQEYCSKKCWARAAREDDRRKVPNEERKGAKPMQAVCTEVEREHLRMAPQRLKEREVVLEVRRSANALEAAREKSYALWFSLLGVAA